MTSCKPSNLWQAFRRGFEDFGELIRDAVNFILLFPAYLIGVGLTSLVAKLAGKSFLTLKPSKKKKSYWVKHEKVSTSIENYYRQF